MSKKKKKEKRLVVGSYGINNFVPNFSLKGEKNTLDNILELEAKELAQRAKAVSIQSYIARKEGEIRESEKASQNPGSSSDFLKEILANKSLKEEFFKLTDAERTILLTSRNLMNSSGSGGQAAYLPLVLSMLKGSPNGSLKETIEIVNLLKAQNPGKDSSVELLKILLPLIVSKNQSGGNFKALMSIVQPLFNSLTDKDRLYFSSQIQHLQGQIASPREILKSVSENASMMGYQRTGDSNALMEIEKMKINQNRWQIEESWKREEARENREMQRESDKRRWNALETVGTKWMDKASPILDAGIQAAQRRITRGPTPPQPPGSVEIMTESGPAVPCSKCNFRMPLIGSPEILTCPSCGEVHRRNVELQQPAQVKVMKDVKKHVES